MIQFLGFCVVATVLQAGEAETALSFAERFLASAEKNRLSDAEAQQAAELLDHRHPFVRGIAEWALARKVGHENNGQQAVWPRRDAPAWYRRWAALEGPFLLEADWVRQAVTAGLHRDPARLAASVESLVQRAQRMALDFRRQGLRAEADARLETLLDELRTASSRIQQMSLKSRISTGSSRIRENSEAAEVASPRETPPNSHEFGYAQRQLPTPSTSEAAEIAAAETWLAARRTLREAALLNPAIRSTQVVFVKQFAPHTTRNITRSFPWQHKPGGDICVLEGWQPGAPVREVLRGQLGPGHVRGLDLWWDADRVVFGYARQPAWPPPCNTVNADTESIQAVALRRSQEPMHVFEVRLDGGGLRQRTADPRWNDFEPTWCANGDVVFSSDRCGRSAECGAFFSEIPNANLYAVSADGQVRQLTDNKDVDRYPHSLDNGLIGYTHWEYQERHFMEVHALWTVRPDGTLSDALFKHHMPAPLSLRDTRSVPGSQQLVSIASGHHTFAQGPVVLVDPRAGLNAAAGLRIVTPGVLPQEGPMAGRPVAEGGVPDKGGLYQTPWALSETCFLVSYSYARPNCTAPVGADSNGFALYLIDVYGNRELLHRDLLLSCCYPIALAPRPRPPLLPTLAEKSAPEAIGYVADVYAGMPEIPRGTIKALRISQHVAWPYEAERGMMPYMTGAFYARQFGYWDWSPVRVIGTVPVEADGSACFTVPPDTALYFQALDQRHMEIRRMRSMVSLAPGEVRGCRGCHESQAKPPWVGGSGLLALRKPPQRPEPPPWGADKTLGYVELVQPIFERHCVRCHGPREPDGQLDLSATVMPDGFVQSFRSLFGVAPGQDKPAGRTLVAVADRFSNSSVTRPREFGSHRSPLVQVLLEDELHRRESPLSEQEWRTLVTWVDANAPYHDKFLDRRPPGGGPPRRSILARQLPPPWADGGAR